MVQKQAREGGAGSKARARRSARQSINANNLWSELIASFGRPERFWADEPFSSGIPRWPKFGPTLVCVRRPDCLCPQESGTHSYQGAQSDIAHLGNSDRRNKFRADFQTRPTKLRSRGRSAPSKVRNVKCDCAAHPVDMRTVIQSAATNLLPWSDSDPTENSCQGARVRQRQRHNRQSGRFWCHLIRLNLNHAREERTSKEMATVAARWRAGL